MGLLCKIAVVVLSLSLWLPRSQAQDWHKICGSIFVDREIDFTDNEETLLCGDDSQAWGTIPLNQAQYHLNIFLQQRGFFKAQFNTDYEKKQMRVETGARHRIAKVAFVGHPDEMVPERRRKLLGEPLTPEKLDSIESWTRGELATIGYPCADVQLAADPDTGEVRVGIAPGLFQTFGSLERENVEGLEESALARYDAFHLGQTYDARLLRLTSNRMLIDGLVPSTYFITECSPEGAKLTQRIIPGKPRLVTVEIGATTEEFPVFRARWSNTRLGRVASSITAAAAYSPREQSLSLSGNAYFDHDVPGFSLVPSLEVVRSTPDVESLKVFEGTSDSDIESVTTTLSTLASYVFDDYERRYRLRSGPAVENKDKIEGETGRDETYLLIENYVEVIDHDYEINKGNPQRGYRGLLGLSFREKGFFSEITMKRLNYEYKHLWNYAHYDPPLFITGLRFRYTSLLVNGIEEARRLLTEDEFLRMGGDRDLRGFNREELAGLTDLGYFSVLYAGLEGRLSGELPWGIEPILFVDAAKVAQRPNDFSDEIYWSPGIGFRWATPVGVFRASAAHGYVSGRPEAQIKNDSVTREAVERYIDDITHMTYFLSYGTEF